MKRLGKLWKTMGKAYLGCATGLVGGSLVGGIFGSGACVGTGVGLEGECRVERPIRYFELICVTCNQTLCFSPLDYSSSMHEARVCACLRIAAAVAAAREPKRPEWFPTFKRWGRKTIRAVVNTVERFRSAWVAFWTGADREVKA